MPLSPKQCILAGWGNTPTDRPYVIASIGSIRGGKTWSAALGLFLYSQTLPPLPPGFIHLLVGRKVSVLEEAVVAPLKAFAEEATLPHRYDRGRSMLHIGRHQYKLLAGENILSEAAPMGFSVGCALIDEASLLSEDFVNRVLSRLTLPYSKAWLCANPTTPSSWLKKKIDDPTGQIDEAVHFTMGDNPTLSEANKSFFRGLFKGANYERLIEGIWSQAEGAIYPQFEAVEVDDLPDFWVVDVRVSVDPGYSQCYASLYAAQTRKGNTIIYDEYAWRPAQGERTPAEHAQAVIGQAGAHALQGVWPDPSVYLIDPAAAGDVAEYESRDCFAPSFPKDVSAGIANVRNRLEEPTYYILRRCENLLTELQGYTWDAKASERGEDRPMSGNDHFVDCLRYDCEYAYPAEGFARYV